MRARHASKMRARCERDASEMRARCERDARGDGGDAWNHTRCVVKIGTFNAFESSVGPYVTVHLVALLLAIGGLKRGKVDCDMHGSVPGWMGVMVLVARRTVSCSSRSRRASSSPQVSHSGCCVALTSMISLKDFHVFLKRVRLPTGGRPLSIRKSTKAW